MLSGELTVKINGRIKLLTQGDILHIPANTAHAMWNDSRGITIVNWKVQPALNTEHFLETVIGLANDGKTNKHGRPNMLQVSLVANKFARVFRLVKPHYFVQQVLFTLLAPVAYLFGYKPTYKRHID